MSGLWKGGKDVTEKDGFCSPELYTAWPGQTVQALLHQLSGGLSLLPALQGITNRGDVLWSVSFPAAMPSEFWVPPGNSASLTLPLCAQRGDASTQGLALVLKGKDSPAPDGRHLVSGLGATHLENRQRPNFRLSSAGLKVSMWGHIKVNMPERKSTCP